MPIVLPLFPFMFAFVQNILFVWKQCQQAKILLAQDFFISFVLFFIIRTVHFYFLLCQANTKTSLADARSDATYHPYTVFAVMSLVTCALPFYFTAIVSGTSWHTHHLLVLKIYKIIKEKKINKMRENTGKEVLNTK